MQSRRYIGVITSILLLAALLLLFTDPWSTLRNEVKRISLQDPDRIDRIFLYDARDSTSLLSSKDGWVLLGSEPANPVAVENLIYAASHLQIISILSKSDETVNREVRMVEFYSGQKRVLGLELLSPGGEGRVRPAGTDRTYVVSIAGYPDQDLDRIFSASANHYREGLLVDLLPSEISLIEIEPAGEEPFRFTQDRQGEIACFRSGASHPVESDSLDELSVRLLFSYFTSIRCEAKDVPGGESQLSPADSGRYIARLRVESHEGEKHTLEVYPYHEKPGENQHMFLALVLHNNGPRPLIVNYIYLDVLMRGLPHYFGEK